MRGTCAVTRAVRSTVSQSLAQLKRQAICLPLELCKESVNGQCQPMEILTGHVIPSFITTEVF